MAVPMMYGPPSTPVAYPHHIASHGLAHSGFAGFPSQSWAARPPLSIPSSPPRLGTQQPSDAAMTQYYRTQLKDWENRRDATTTAMREHKSWLHSFKRELDDHMVLGDSTGRPKTGPDAASRRKWNAKYAESSGGGGSGGGGAWSD